MASLEKTINILTSDLAGEINLSHLLDEDQEKEIVQRTITGYNIDKDSMQEWVDKNKEAVNLIRQYEDEEINDESGIKENPFSGACKVIYPLLGPAVIHLASRMVSQLTRNQKVVEVATAGKDPDGTVKERATRVADHMSWQLLVESRSWLKESHKLMSIVASWGTGFREVYRDHITKKNQSDILSPEDVIVNNNITSLEKAPRITIKKYFNKNDLKEAMNAGIFSDDLDIDQIVKSHSNDRKTDPEDDFAVITVLKQYCLIDLDNDGYSEPYIVFVHEDSDTLLGLQAYYDQDDLIIKDGKLVAIKAQPFVVDYHCIDDPNGRFFSIGLNYLLYNPNKILNTLSRQLIDAGTLANQQGGFVTRAFKINNRDLTFELGEYKVVDTPPDVDLAKQIYTLPFKEPSQVLLAMLQTMIEAGEKLGFITDVMTGDMAAQNVPATSMLALVEASTRAIKPLIQKLYCSLSNEFRAWYRLNYKYLSDDEYQEYHNDPNVYVQTPSGLAQPQLPPPMSAQMSGTGGMQSPEISGENGGLAPQMPPQLPGGPLGPQIGQQMGPGMGGGQNPQIPPQMAAMMQKAMKPPIGDYEFKDLDIRPVADPTMSSEAHKYAKLRALLESVQIFPTTTNVVEIQKEYYSGLNIENPDKFVTNPPPQQMDPKMMQAAMELQLKQQKQEHDMKLDEVNTQIKQKALEIQEMDKKLKTMELQIKKNESDDKQKKMQAEAFKDRHEGNIKERQTRIAEFEANTKRMQAEALEKKANAESTKKSD